MKKILKTVLLSLMVILLLVLTGSYIAYSTYRPADKYTQVDTSFLHYYHETFEDCQIAFQEGARNLQYTFEGMETGRISVPGQADENLSIDWCYIPAEGPKNKLILISSGIHGIEGYTGSAIQMMFMDRILKEPLPQGMGVMILHGINPYGFKYGRRVTANNIDLNRNCVPDFIQNEAGNEGYDELVSLLTPAGPADTKDMRNRFFYLVALRKLMQKSMPALRQAIMQGQYDHEKGISYGGNELEPQIKSLQSLLEKYLGQYSSILSVDLHTGYGQRGEMYLFVDKPRDEAVLDATIEIFQGYELNWSSGKDFYTVNGEYTTWIKSLITETLYIPMVLEFGTVNSNETLGSLKSLQIMILENQGVQNGYKNEREVARIRYLFKEMYYPSSGSWRSNVISDAHRLLSKAMERLEEL